MSQDAFCSVYTKDYRWFKDVDRPKLYRGIDIAADSERDAAFLSTGKLARVLGPETDAIIQNLYDLRMKSTYKVSYCEDRFPKSEMGLDPLQDDELMDSMQRALYPAPRKVLIPPATSRVVYAYCPMRQFLSKRSVYMDVHNRPAFDGLKRNMLEKGTSRLAPSCPSTKDFKIADLECKNRTFRNPEGESWIHLKPEPKPQ